MNLRNDIQTEAIEVNFQSSGIIEEEPFNLLPEDGIDEELGRKRHRSQSSTNRNTR